MQDEITKALGLPDLPPAQFERARKAILEDNFFYTRCLSTLVLGVAGKVAASLHPLEQQRMRNIAGFSTQERGKATWGIVENIKNGVAALKASCPACKQDMNFMQPAPWSEEIPYDRGSGIRGTTTKWHDVTAADVKAAIQNIQWQHCGHMEKPPADLLLVWEERLMGRVR